MNGGEAAGARASSRSADGVQWADPEAIKRRLQSMDDFAFEQFVADLWTRRGWQTAVEQQSGDAGIDVRAVKSGPVGRKLLIQAKRYAPGTNVSGPSVQQYAALKQQEDGVDRVLVVTTSGFTGPARQRGRELGVELVDGDDLVELVLETGAVDLVEGYTEATGSAGGEPAALGWRGWGLAGAAVAQALGAAMIEFGRGGGPLDAPLTVAYAVVAVGWIGGAWLLVRQVGRASVSGWRRVFYVSAAVLPVYCAMGIGVYLLGRIAAVVGRDG